MSNQIPSFGYISSGEIHLINSDFSELKVDSYFAQKTKENAQANQNRHGWKNNAELGAFDSWGGAKYSHWNEHKVIFTSFSQSKEKEYLYYLLQLPDAVGLFRYAFDDESEYRAFHTNQVEISTIAYHPEKDILLGSFPHEGQSHIGTLANNTLEYKLYTEGDVFDSAPSWDISNPDLIYYQSSGVGRNQDGYIFGIGPSSIHSLNLETSDQEVVFEDELYDFLIPKPDSKSNLYYLKRPYEQQELNVPWYKALLDIILIPFYFIKGIINIVDGLSKIFSSNKQILHAGPQQPQNNNLNRWITLKGANIDLHKLKRTKDNDGSVVPKSWQLLCRQANGEVVLVADSVLDFDVSADGDVICTNGYKVFQIKEGKKKQLHKTTSIIEQVRWVTLPKNSR